MRRLFLPRIVLGVTLIPLASPSFADVSVVLTDQEKSALLQLIDLGVKQGGLSVAGNADYMARKINEAPPVVSPTSSAPPKVPDVGTKP